MYGYSGGLQLGNEEKKLSPRQAEILAFLKECCDARGRPPSYREIQKHFGLRTVATVYEHMKALEEKGAIQKLDDARNERRARNLVPKGFEPLRGKKVPIYGEVAAGSPREAHQIDFGELLVPAAISSHPTFCLRVTGDSMVDAGIIEGDFLVVEKGAKIANGDIVVALVEGETTVKRFYRRSDGVYLVPENKRFKEMKVSEQRLEIQGKVVGLQRKI